MLQYKKPMKALKNFLAKLKDPRTNWKSILILIVLVFLVSGGILCLRYFQTKEVLTIKTGELANKTKEIEKKAPRIMINEIYWYKGKSENSGGYRINFDEYNLKIEIDPREENIIKRIIECAREHKVEINLRSG